MESLPVQYYANKNAWMTSGIFKNWLMSWDMELQYKERNILLLVDNCAAHPHVPHPHPCVGAANEHGDHKKFEDFVSRKIS